jgi:hypothetical protein
MGLLIYPKEIREKVEKYRYFADEKRWRELEELFVKESYALYSMSQTPMVNLMLQTGISVLKTEFCTNDTTLNE